MKLKAGDKVIYKGFTGNGIPHGEEVTIASATALATGPQMVVVSWENIMTSVDRDLLGPIKTLMTISPQITDKVF